MSFEFLKFFRAVSLDASVRETGLVEACATSHCRVDWRSADPPSQEVMLRVADVSLCGTHMEVFKNTEIVQTCYMM